MRVNHQHFTRAHIVLALILLVVAVSLVAHTAPSRHRWTPRRVEGRVPSVVSTAQSAPPADHDSDGRIDTQSDTPAMEAARAQGAAAAAFSLGMLETGEYEWSYERLQSLCLDPRLVSPDADLETLRQYDLIYLPVQWAQKDVGEYVTIEAHASAYRTYVQDGGMLFVDQPNPYQQPDERVSPGLLPYPITFYNPFDAGDYPPAVVNPHHPVTHGVPANDLPFPADQMLDVDSRYEVLVQGPSSGAPSLIVGDYGAGRILIQTAHPGNDVSVGHPFSNRAYMQMLAWLGATACPVYLPVVVGG